MGIRKLNKGEVLLYRKFEVKEVTRPSAGDCQPPHRNHVKIIV